MRDSIAMSFHSTPQGEAVSDKDSVLCVTSILAYSSYPHVTSLLYTKSSRSDWCDDSLRQETFSMPSDKGSIKSYDTSNQQWFDETDEDEDEESVDMRNRLSMLTFGLQFSSSSSSSDSQDSDTITEIYEDSDEFSCLSSTRKTVDCLDEELLHSPVGSFAALCYESAVLDQPSDQPQPSEASGITQEKRTAQLRLSTLYNDDAHDYEEEQSLQSEDLDALTLPPMEFVPKAPIASSEVAPWLHIPRKAVSILDLPQDLLSSTPLQLVPGSRLRQHRRGMSLGISQETVLAKYKKNH